MLSGDKIALNLGGGAARGYAHIGAIRAIRENHIPFTHIIGVSMGAIVGGVYAVTPDVDFLQNRMVELVNSRNFRESIIGTWSRNMNESARSFMKRAQKFYNSTGILSRFFLAPGVISQPEMHNLIDPFLANIRMEHTRVKFACNAVDIKEGSLKVFTGKSPLRAAVLASAAMPLIFPPQRVDGHLYVDGGVLDKIGIESARSLGIKKIIAIDVSDEQLPDQIPRSAFDVFLKTEEITSMHRKNSQLSKASIVLKPIRGNFHWAEYSAYQEFIEMGYECVAENVSNIRDALKLTNPFRRLFYMLRR